MKTAFQELLTHTGLEEFKKYREALINKAGSFANGYFIQYNMGLRLDGINSDKIKRIIVKKQSGGEDQNSGFCFNNDGTTKAIERIIRGDSISLFEFSDFFLFDDKTDQDMWKATKDTDKRRLIAQTLTTYKKKTDVQYRTLGDRCHYFVIGRVVIKEKNESDCYPLFLFPLECDEKKQIVKIDRTGFGNFWVDKNRLQNAIYKDKTDFETTIDDQFIGKLRGIKKSLERINLSQLDIKCDTSSFISIVTGFEPEYLDLSWNEILKGN